MPFSGMLHQTALVRTDISEERVASIIRVTRLGDLGTTLAVTAHCEKVICVVRGERNGTEVLQEFSPRLFGFPR
jgi:hypothetical protein